MKLFIDLDGVLADFESGTQKLLGIPKDVWDQHRILGEWHMCKGIGNALGREFTEDHFWEAIHSVGEKFWEDLEPLPWMSSLIELIEDYQVDWYILTAPSRHPSSYVGKMNWMKKHFGERFDKYLITKHKMLVARKQRILIDDNEKNIVDFESRGGTGILFPSFSNHQHEFRDDPLRTVEAWLDVLIPHLRND